MIGLTVTLMSGDMLSSEKLIELKKTVKTLQSGAISVIKGKDLDTVYHLQIKLGRQQGDKLIEAFVDKKTGAIYMGGGYDKDGEKLKLPADVKIVEDAVALSFGSGKNELYVVVDPECQYSKDFVKNIGGKLSDYTVKVILFPLDFHKNAKKMTSYILDGKDNNEKVDRLKKTMIKDKNFYTQSKERIDSINNYMLKSNLAIKELDAKGTPSFYTKENGEIREISPNEISNDN